MKTTVINIKNAPKDWKKSMTHVYIGRPGHGQAGYFGNPYRLKDGTARGSTIEAFKKYFYDRLATDKEFFSEIHDLKGKTLVCFCKPYACHGDVIAEYLNSKE